MLKYNCKIIVVLFALILIGACSNHVPAPVIDLNLSSKSTISNNKNALSPLNSFSKNNIHKVKAGETLFSIAWRYALDHNELAKINNIKSNKIYPGQLLNLINTKLVNNDLSIFNAQSLITALNSEILNKEYRLPSSLNSSNQTKRRSKKSPSAKRKQILRQATSSNHSKLSPKLTRNPKGDNSVKRWIWPVNGKVIKHFSKKLNQNKGLDIVAKKGTAVRATAQGKVVYSGSGLRGYGRLVIIKHNDAFLSAYAHNEKIHVEENEFVKAGQRIADLGNSGSNIDKLHFEIRYKGKPVDPLNYLPKSDYL